MLVHGSGGGAWAWDGVRPLLEQAGHRVRCPSLSGMGDAETSLEDHVGDVVRTITRDDLNRVQLVGHSYGGMPITGAAEHVPERLARLVYLDAFVPEDGSSAFDTRPDLDAALRSKAQGGLIPPLDPWFAGVETEEQGQRLGRLLTTTPLRACTDRIELRNPKAHQIPPHLCLLHEVRLRPNGGAGPRRRVGLSRARHLSHGDGGGSARGGRAAVRDRRTGRVQCERYRDGPGLELPVSVRVAPARKAGA